MDENQIEKFLSEGTEYFKTQKFPEIFPAHIAQISESIKNFNQTVKNSSDSTEKLSRSIKNLTLCAVIISGVALTWDIIKFILEKINIY